MTRNTEKIHRNSPLPENLNRHWHSTRLRENDIILFHSRKTLIIQNKNIKNAVFAFEIFT